MKTPALLEWLELDDLERFADLFEENGLNISVRPTNPSLQTQSPCARSSNLENGPEANTMRPPTMVSSEVIEPTSAVATLK